MAKTNSIIVDGLQGTLGSLTFVKSRRYKEHVRSKRGTHKPAVLNNTFQENKERLKLAMVPAKMIFNAMRDEHKDGTLWTRLLAAFRKKIKDGMAPDMHCLADLECSKENRLEHFLGNFHINVVVTNGIMTVTVKPDSPPRWRKNKVVDAYRIGITAIFPDFIKNTMDRSVCPGVVTPLEAPPGPFLFEIPIPENASQYALFMKIEGCRKEKPLNQVNVTGMRVVKTGVLD